MLVSMGLMYSSYGCACFDVGLSSANAMYQYVVYETIYYRSAKLHETRQNNRDD